MLLFTHVLVISAHSVTTVFLPLTVPILIRTWSCRLALCWNRVAELVLVESEAVVAREVKTEEKVIYTLGLHLACSERHTIQKKLKKITN